MNDSENIKPVIIDTAYYSIGFPKEDWKKMIRRDNYINQIENFLNKEIKIVFIEGEEDAGKTTLCAQFAKENLNNSITVFFNPNSKLDYKLDYVYLNVSEQIRFLVHNDNNTKYENDYFTYEEYRYFVFQLRKKIKRNDEIIYLIIDGLEEKVKQEPEFVSELFDILPFGENFFRFIIVGNPDEFLNVCPKLKKQEIKVISLTGFSLPEINDYLEIDEYSTNEINELFKITNGFPGRLKTLKRIIKNDNYSIEKIDKTTTYKHLLELDCKAIDLNSPIINGLLSILALNEELFTVDEISIICSLSIEETTSLIKSLRIIELNDNKLSFISNAHKKYFANILRANKNKIDELLIKYYANEDTIKAKYELTKLYSRKEDWGKVLDLIDEQYLQSILEGTGTLSKVNECLDIGVQASEKLNKYIKIWSYSIQGSIVNELDNYLFWESEIEARISIRDFVGAIALAESAILRIDRLKLLALIARRQKEIIQNVDEDLISLIQDLYRITDFTSVGNKIYDIVADLIYAIPNLAIEMIEKSSGKTSEKNINDWIIAKLSVAAIDSSQKEKDDLTNNKKLEAVQNLNNPSVRKINRAISFLVGNYTSTKVLEEVKKLSDSNERLRLLRLWLNNNRKNIKDVEIVIDVALNELVASTSESTITLDVLKELSFQLPYVIDISKKRTLLKRFQSIEKDLHDLGLSKNKYIYQLNIFHTIYTYNPQESISYINSIIVEIESITDVLIKVESFSEVYSKLIIIKNDLFIDKLKFAYSRILSLSNELFIKTANHYKVSQYLIETISKKNPVLSLKICTEINTKFRREKSRLLILDSYLDNNIKHIKIELLKVIVDSFENSNSKIEGYQRILERFSEPKSLNHEIIKSLLFFINKIDTIKDPSKRVKGLVLSLKILTKNELWSTKLSKNIENKIYKTWAEIDADWERIDIGFEICSQIAQINNNFADKIFKESIELKKNSWIDSKIVAYTYLNNLKIIIKAFDGLVISGNDSKKEFSIIEDLINRIPSLSEKLNIWTEIGINCYMSNRIDTSKQIFDKHVLPLLHTLVSKNFDIVDVLHSITLVHIFNPELAIEFLDSINEDLREEVYSNLSNFYITKRNPFEVYESSKNLKYECSFSDINKSLNLINLINTDNLIYNQIDSVINAIKNNTNNISKVQVTSISEKLKDIINSKLPDSSNIKHNGYKIIALVKLSLISKETVDWMQILNETNCIPNISDKIFVKSILLDTIPFEKITSGQILKKDIIDEIISGLKSFNIHYEYVQRVIDISETMYKFDRLRWKDIVNSAFTFSNQFEVGSEIYASQKSIIDSMYRLDPSFAKELIKSTDSENKNSYLKNLINNYYDTLEVSKKIKNNESIENKEKENYKIIVNGIFKALAALNSGKITTKKINEVSKYLPLGIKLPLHEVFPIYMFYLSNCAKTYKSISVQSPMANIHNDNFIEAVKSIDLIQLLSHKKKYNEKSFRNFFIDQDFTLNTTVKPNSREEAFEYLRKWMYDELEEYIYIVDSYFAKEDLEIVKIVKEINENVEIEILGSSDGFKNNIEEDYKSYWNKISDELPPFTNITFCWLPEDNNNKPIHDRWIITKNSGIRLGTSINSLGVKKESELSIMKPTESLNVLENTVKEFLNKKKKHINNQRLSYKSFNL